MQKAEILALLHLTLDNIARRIKERIQYLKKKKRELEIIAYLEHHLTLLKNSRFRNQIFTNQSEMKKNTAQKHINQSSTD